MTDFREVLKQRQERQNPDVDQSFEAKHARAMEKLNRQLKPRIDALRLIGPAQPQMQDKHRVLIRDRNSDMFIGRCRFCNPEPRTYACPLCDWSTQEKYQMTLHNRCSPKWCSDRAAKKARKWAQHA